MSLSHSIRSVLLVLAVVLAAGTASAQVVDNSRPEAELRADVREAVERDTDVANTALVFNNPRPGEAHVFCIAFDAHGQVLGRRVAHIPGRGVRYLRASDFSGGADFIGSARCDSRQRVAATAVFLAPGAITNLDVLQADRWDDSHRIRFPLIATY